MRIVVSYDVSDNKRRRKVAQIMEGFGYRVQYSVFECDLNSKKLVELKRRLRPLINKREGESVRFYPLCAECAPKAQVLGQDLGRLLEPVEIV
jgi:CRISPR-associated protein Cas2